MSVDSKDGGLYEESAERVVDFVRALAVNPTRPHVSESESQKVRDVRKARHQKNEKKRKASSMNNSGDASPPNPRRVKRTTRGASPSHFYVDEAEQNMFDQKTNKEYLQKLPMRHRVDNVLRAVSSMYYNRNQVVDQGKNVIDQANAHNTMPLSTLDRLTHPLRKPGVLDNWTPREIALFESGICSKGKDFYAISKIVETKTTAEVVDFYYDWKKSGHYVMWKYFKRPTEKYPSSRMQQMSAINSKMKGYHKPPPSSVPSSSTPVAAAAVSPRAAEAGAAATVGTTELSPSSSSAANGGGNAGAELAVPAKVDEEVAPDSAAMNDDGEDEEADTPASSPEKASASEGATTSPMAEVSDGEDGKEEEVEAAAEEEDVGGSDAMEDDDDKVNDEDEEVAVEEEASEK